MVISVGVEGTISTVGIFACFEIEATAAASGVRAKPPSRLTLSRMTSSSATCLAVAGLTSR